MCGNHLKKCCSKHVKSIFHSIVIKSNLRWIVLGFACLNSVRLRVLLPGTSLAVQWLRIHASTAEGAGSVPGWGTKIPHATCGKRKKKNVASVVINLRRLHVREGRRQKREHALSLLVPCVAQRHSRAAPAALLPDGVGGPCRPIHAQLCLLCSLAFQSPLLRQSGK